MQNITSKNWQLNKITSKETKDIIINKAADNKTIKRIKFIKITIRYSKIKISIFSLMIENKQ
jgi:hypothetical protein